MASTPSVSPTARSAGSFMRARTALQIPRLVPRRRGSGRRLSGRTRRGNAWLRRALAAVANVVSRMKSTYLAAQFRRIAARRGRSRAVVAVGHSVLVAIYYRLTRREPYHELGAQSFDEYER